MQAGDDDVVVDVYVSFSPVRYDEEGKQFLSIGGQLSKKISINLKLIDTARRLLMLIYEELRERIFPEMGWAQRMMHAHIGLIGTRMNNDGSGCCRHFILTLDDRLENFGRFFYAVSPMTPEFFQPLRQMDRYFYSEKMYCQHHRRHHHQRHEDVGDDGKIESNAGLEEVLKFFPIKELFKPVRIVEKASLNRCVINRNLPASNIYERDSDFYVIDELGRVRYACSGHVESLLSSVDNSSGGGACHGNPFKKATT